VYSSVNLLGLYHDSLFTKTAWNDPGASLSNRYVAYFSQAFPLYKRAATVLSVLKNLEVLLEMISQRLTGPQHKWKLVLLIEACRYGSRDLSLLLFFAACSHCHHPFRD